MEHYSSIKRNKLLTHTTTWMDIQILMLNEKSLIYHDRNQISVCLGQRSREGWMTGREISRGDGNVYHLDCGNGFKGVCLCHGIVTKLIATYCMLIVPQ